MGEDIRPEAAVRAAKKWLEEIYADEFITKIGLEEVRLCDGRWEITLGFNRSETGSAAQGNSTAPDMLVGSNPLAAALDRVASQRRIYKVVVVAGNDNHVIEMHDREVA